MKSPMVTAASYIKDKGSYTELKVLCSGAGYYVGTLYNNPEGFQEPGSRDSDYFDTSADAQQFLDTLEKIEKAGEDRPEFAGLAAVAIATKVRLEP